MNGIDKIIARLENDAKAEIAAMNAENDAKCAEIKQEYEKKAQDEYRKRVQAGTKDCESRVQRLGSAADMETRKSILAFKQEMVSVAFDRAVAGISQMPADKYTAFLAAQAAMAVSYGTEELIFNAADKAKVGSAVVKAANTALESRGIAGKLTVAEETRDIPGGVIIKQGNIEVNCSVDILAQMHRNELAAQVAEILFE